MGFLVVFLLRTLATIYWIQPRGFQLFWGRCLGWILKQVGFRTRIVRANLLRAYPDQIREQERIFKESYVHLGRLFLEILLLFGPLLRVPFLVRFVMRQMTLKGREHSHAALQNGKGVIFLGSHLGNWEVMIVGGAVLANVNVLMVTKQIKPRWLHQILERGRLII